MTTGAERFTPLRPLGPYLLLVQDANGAPLVLKRLPDERIADPLAYHDFRLEAWRAAQLDGPRFMRAVDDGTATRERPFYTMAYAEGPPATLVQPAEAAACVRHLAEALVSLHDRGWVHAALEPVQLRRTEAGLVVVGYGNLTPHGQRARRRGAGPYEAPEQAAGLPLDGRTDLYALGTLIHFWLTGEASGQLDLLDLVADPLAELGRWLLATRPGDRPADARTFLAALDRALPQGRRPLANTDTPRAPWIVAPPPANRSLAPFDALLTQLDGGQGAWRRLTSQPGAGKSAWLDRAAARARSAGWPVFRASGEGHWASPLAPWRVLWQAWQTLAEERQPGLVERFRYRLGSLADPPLEPTAGVSTPWGMELQRERSLLALGEFLSALAPPGMVVLLDDWDLADEGSRAVFEALRERLQEVPVLWLVTGDEGPPALEVLELPVLEREEGRALVRGLLAAPPSPDATDELIGACNGQPWFLQTLIHAWVDQGEVRPGLGALPPSNTWPTQSAALARLAASVIPEASSWSVGAYAGLLAPRIRPEALDIIVSEPNVLATGLDALLCAGVLRREGDTYRFAHPAYLAIYERVLPPAARAEAHRRLAVAGANNRPAPGERLALANHAIHADAPELAGTLALEASRVALANGALETARSLLEEGLVTLPGDHPARGRYMALLGEIARRRGQRADAVTLFEAAREALPGGPERQGVALALAHALVELDLNERAIEFWREAAGHAQGQGDMDSLASALAGLCESQAALGRGDDAIASGEAALGVAAEAGPLPRARAMGALGAQLANAGRERQAEGIALMQRAAALLEAEGDRPRLLIIQRRLAEAELARGELLFARDTAAKARDLAGQDEPEAQARGALLHAYACWALGDAAAAITEAAATRRLAETYGLATLAAEARGLEGLACAQDDPKSGVALGAEALIRLAKAASPTARARLWLWHAEALMAAKQFPEAANALYEAQAPIKQGNLADLAGQRAYLLGVWAAATGDRERARQELRATLAQPNQWLVARSALLLGQIALEAGARTEAAGWLEQARRSALALGAERLATEAERTERLLAQAAAPNDGSPSQAATRLEALFEEARSLLPALLDPARTVSELSEELVGARAVNVLWEALFDAMGPRQMASAMAVATFAATQARRIFILGKDLAPLLAQARTGELPFEPGMIHAVLCRRAMELGQWQVEAGETPALAIPLATPRRVIGVLYVVGIAANAEGENQPAINTLLAIAAAGALAIERLVVPPPGE